MKHKTFLPLLIFFLALTKSLSGADLISASKLSYCIDDVIIIESIFSDTVNFTVNWEYAKVENDWRSVSELSTTIKTNNQHLYISSFDDSTTIKIRCRYFDGSISKDSLSNTIEFSVYAKLQTGVISGDQNICHNTAATPISFSTNPTGGGNSYSYKWLQSNNNSTFTEIEGETENTYQSPNLTTSKYYKAVVISNLGCSTDTTNSVFVNVYQPIVAGKIEIGGLKTDTICYNTSPKLLTISQPATGGNGTFTYQWQYSTNGTVWQNENNATQTSYSPGNLTASRYYRLQFSTSCGIVYSDTVQAFVWSDLVKAETGTNQTICWNTTPNELTTTKLPTGGNGKFTYQWQVLQASNWIDINGAQSQAYQPTALQTTTQYRLRNTSLYGCGVVYANPITITVYPKLQAGAITDNQNICHNTAAAPITFSTNPTGGGNSYSYKWLQSNNNSTFTEIEGETENTYQSPNLTTSKYYKAVVISNLGCSTDTTNSVFVNVYQPIVAGKIEIGGLKTDTICYNTSPKLLTISQPATGGNGTFTYQWQYSTNGTVWQNENNATQTSYSPANLTASRYYRLQFSTSCGVMYSDIVEVYVNPLPTPKILSGNFSVCSNQKDNIYTIENHQNNILYDWSVSNGVFTTNYPNNLKSISVDWGKQSGTGTISLKQTDIITGCVRDSNYIVNITANMSPDKTIIARKATSNILYCQEATSNIEYQWGYINKGNGQATYIQDSNQRYVLLPHAFDSNLYDYFVETSFKYPTQSCSTRSLMNSSPQNIIKDEKIKFDIFPNPVTDKLFVTVEKPISDNEEVELSIIDFCGRVLWKNIYGAEAYQQPLQIPIQLENGIYLMQLRSDIEVLTRKFLVK